MFLRAWASGNPREAGQFAKTTAWSYPGLNLAANAMISRITTESIGHPWECYKFAVAKSGCPFRCGREIGRGDRAPAGSAAAAIYRAEALLPVFVFNAI
jgi:hypothetical protein